MWQSRLLQHLRSGTAAISAEASFCTANHAATIRHFSALRAAARPALCRELFNGANIGSHVSWNSLSIRAFARRAARSYSSLIKQITPRSTQSRIPIQRRLTSSKSGKTDVPHGSFADVKQMIKLAGPEKKMLAMAVLFLVFSSAVSLSVPFGMGKIIDAVLIKDSQQPLESRLTGIAIILSFIFVLGAGANFGRVWYIQRSGQQIIARLRSQLFQSITSQEIGFFDHHSTGALINRLAADTSLVGRALTDNLSDGWRNFAQVVIGGGMMFYLSPTLATTVLMIIPPLAIFGGFFGRSLRKISAQVQDALAHTTEIAEERISNIRQVRAFSKEEEESHKYTTEVNNVLNLSNKETLLRASFYGVIGFGGNMSLVAVLIHGGLLTESGAMSVGDLSAFLLYSAYVALSINGVATFYSEMMKGAGASAKLFELLNRKPHIPLKGGVVLPHVKGEISFENVSFTYPTREDSLILNNFNLQIKEGQSQALVGASGSGKSTIYSLLLRFYNPCSGRILLDGVDISTLDPSWMRKQIGIVAQEPVLFSGTIAENIAYSNPAATIDQIQKAAREANASEFIEEFADGYQTYVGERGQRLSTGQKQRIAIARAILKDPRILILDEATSALDSISEALIKEALDRIMKNKTVIIIAHRLKTIQHADVIAVLQNGAVAELGDYETLIQRKQLFAELVTKQSHFAN